MAFDVEAFIKDWAHSTAERVVDDLRAAVDGYLNAKDADEYFRAVEILRNKANTVLKAKNPTPDHAFVQKIDWKKARKDPDIFALMHEKGCITWVGGSQQSEEEGQG